MPHSSSTYRQPPSQDQAPMNAALLASAMKERRSRPMSWHPASRQPEYLAQSQYYQPNTMNSYAQPQKMVDGAVGGQMLPPMTAEVPTMQQNPGFSETGYYPCQQTFLQPNDAPLDEGLWNGPSGLPFVPPMNDWAFDTMSMNQSAPSNYGSVSSPGRLTEPATPDFLPIQQFGDDADPQMSSLEDPDPEDELVGMGLYNKPDTFSDGSLYGMNGKGLKLEETFTPSPQSNETEDSDSEEEDEDEHPQPQQSHSHAQPKPVDNMQKSFFFDDDEPAVPQTRSSFNIAVPPCMNYGYGWI